MIKMTSQAVCVSASEFLAGRGCTCTSSVCKGKKQHPVQKRKVMNNHAVAETFITEDAPGAHWSVYVDLRHNGTRALRKTGAQGAGGGSGSEASFHDLTFTRSLHRDIQSCFWNNRSGEQRRAIMQLPVLWFPSLFTSKLPFNAHSHSLQLLHSCIRPLWGPATRSASLDPQRSQR